MSRYATNRDPRTGTTTSALHPTSPSRTSLRTRFLRFAHLVDACETWGVHHWATAVLANRATEEDWDDGMRAEADSEAEKFHEELVRLRQGLGLLEDNESLRRSFQLANEAFARSPLVSHAEWRPFQLGFLLANIVSLLDDTPNGGRSIVDTLWFATGGGKTETYSAVRPHSRLLRPAAGQA